MRKPLIILPSTPVTKLVFISQGNTVAVGSFTDGADLDVCGASNAILTIGSWSRISSEGKRRATSLISLRKQNRRKYYQRRLRTVCTFLRGCSCTPARVLGCLAVEVLSGSPSFPSSPLDCPSLSMFSVGYPPTRDLPGGADSEISE